MLDQRAGPSPAVLASTGVDRKRAAAALLDRRDDLEPVGREHARRRRVDIAEDLALDAAEQQSDARDALAARRRDRAPGPRGCGTTGASSTSGRNVRGIGEHACRAARARARRAAVGGSGRSGRSACAAGAPTNERRCSCSTCSRVSSISASYCTPDGHAGEAGHAAEAAVEALDRRCRSARPCHRAARPSGGSARAASRPPRPTGGTSDTSAGRTRSARSPRRGRSRSGARSYEHLPGIERRAHALGQPLRAERARDRRARRARGPSRRRRGRGPTARGEERRELCRADRRRGRAGSPALAHLVPDQIVDRARCRGCRRARRPVPRPRPRRPRSAAAGARATRGHRRSGSAPSARRCARAAAASSGSSTSIDDARGRRRQRMQPQARPGDRRVAARRAADELAEVVAGDVLDDRAARVRDRAVGEHERDPEQQVARRAEAMPARPERSPARQPPIVGSPGGSSASSWRWGASLARSAERRTPASTVTVRSPASCASTRSSSRERDLDVAPGASDRDAPAAGGRRAQQLRQLVDGRRLRDARQARPSRADACGAARAPRRRGAASAGACRVRETGRIERVAHPGHHREVVRREHQRHRAGLVDADAVLAGDRAARLDAGAQDRAGARLGALGLALDRPVVQHERDARLPSPAWKTLPTRRPCSTESAWMLPEHGGQLRPSARRRPGRSSRG